MKYKELEVEDYNNIRIRDLDINEFLSFSRYAQGKPFSQFAHFTMLLNGFDLYRNGEKIPKWEAFYISKSAEKILTNQSEVKAVKR